MRVLASLILWLAVSSTALAEPKPKIDTATRQALATAMEDERRAEDTYRAVIARHGDVRPFSRVVEAERRHQRYLLDLFDRYELVPPDRVANKVAVPATLRQACEQAAQAEVKNAALYDRLLAEVTLPDVRETFHRLRDASAKRHLPAFRRCVRRVRR